MQNLIAAIAQGLVDDKESVKVTVDEPDAEGIIVYHLHVAQEDMGKWFRRAAANKAEKKVAVEID